MTSTTTSKVEIEMVDEIEGGSVLRLNGGSDGQVRIELSRRYTEAERLSSLAAALGVYLDEVSAQN